MTTTGSRRSGGTSPTRRWRRCSPSCTRSSGCRRGVPGSARWNVSSARTRSGTSSRSGPLRLGSTTSVRPARWAASTFCFTPPMGSTLPCRVISPVMPTLGFTTLPVSRLTSAVVMVTPADGPSLGTAPAGTCTCTAAPWRPGRRPARLGVRADVGQRDAGRLLHHVAELAGEGERGLAGRCAPSAGNAVVSTNSTSPPAGDGQAGGHAGHVGALGHGVVDLLPAQPVAHVAGVDHDRAGRQARCHLRRHLADQLAQLRSSERTPASRV
jgi:hypothetical protein